MTTTPFPRRTDEARTGMQSSRRRVSGTLSLPCSTRWCAVLTRPASALLWRISAEARTKGDPELLKNLFVLAFQTRWCRGGKGERNVLYHLLVVLYERYAACWWTLWSSFQRTDRGETCSTFSSSAIMATWTMPPCVTRYETCLHAS